MKLEARDYKDYTLELLKKKPLQYSEPHDGLSNIMVLFGFGLACYAKLIGVDLNKP